MGWTRSAPKTGVCAHGGRPGGVPGGSSAVARPCFSPTCCWPFRPCVHHNFKHEIPGKWRCTVRALFVLWHLMALALCWNLITVAVAQNAENIVGIVTAAGFVVCCIPCLYYFWMHQIYEAARRDSTVKYGCFFCGFCFNFGLAVWIAVGVGFGPAGGGAGWMSAKFSGVGILIGINAIVFTVITVLMVFFVQRTALLFRSDGGSAQGLIEAGKGEAARGAVSAASTAASTKTGQAAIKGAVTSAYSSA